MKVPLHAQCQSLDTSAMQLGLRSKVGVCSASKGALPLFVHSTSHFAPSIARAAVPLALYIYIYTLGTLGSPMENTWGGVGWGQ